MWRHTYPTDPGLRKDAHEKSRDGEANKEESGRVGELDDGQLHEQILDDIRRDLVGVPSEAAAQQRVQLRGHLSVETEQRSQHEPVVHGIAGPFEITGSEAQSYQQSAEDEEEDDKGQVDA